MTDYTPDHALDDFLLLEAVLGDKERPDGGRVDLACNRLEDYLMSLPVSKAVPAVPACADCIFLYRRDNTCANAETEDQDKPKAVPSECELRIPFKAVPPGDGV